MKGELAKWLILGLAVMLAACGNDGFFGAGASGTTGQSGVPATVIMTTDLPVILSDSSNKANIIAQVLDANNAAVEGADVVFSTDTGSLNTGSGVTDIEGKATVSVTSGLLNRDNRTLTVTATVGAVASNIPIQVTGTTLTFATPPQSSISDDGANVDTFNLSVQDASGTLISGATVTATIVAGGTGSATVAFADPATKNPSAVTDLAGKLEATVTGTVAGTVTVQYQASGAIATNSYTVTASANTFVFTAPSKFTLDTVPVGSNFVVNVQTPASVTSVTLVTTLGTWVSSGATSVTVTPSGGVSTATLTSTTAGTASLQAFDTNAPSTNDAVDMVFQISAASADTLFLKSNITAVAPSTTTTKNIATLTAKVTATDQPVAGAVVHFSFDSQTSSGETLSPVFAITDAAGEASTTFTSGSLPTGQNSGIVVRATLLNTALTDTIPITVGGTPGSVSIGTGSTITSVNNDTAYDLPMSVLVSDSNGTGLEGVTVTVKVWPERFHFGFWAVSAKNCVAFVTEDVTITPDGFPNEDVNENLVMEAGEDQAYTTDFKDGSGVTLPGWPKNYPANGKLDPENTLAGSLSKATVITGPGGVGDFNLVYQKVSAAWIKVRVSATVQAQGTQTETLYSFWLRPSAADVENKQSCGHLPDNPFGL